VGGNFPNAIESGIYGEIFLYGQKLRQTHIGRGKAGASEYPVAMPEHIFVNTSIDQEVGATRPSNIDKVVVFPAPLLPSKAQIAPY